MIESTQVSDSARGIGARIAYARGKVGLKQEELAVQMGFSDHQTISSIENGIRKVQAEELARLEEVLGTPVDWFLDPFVIAGEGNFSWRVSSSLVKEDLTAFEEKSGTWLGLLRFLRLRLKVSKPSDIFAQTLKVDATTSFEEVSSMAEETARFLDLGKIPAVSLVEKIEQRLDIPVIFFDDRPAAGDISGAMCKMRNLRVILINRHEPPARRSFDVAHELFHALTWDALTPEHMEVSKEGTTKKVKKSGAKSRQQRIERLADNFATALLMPREVLSRAIEPGRKDDLDYLAEMANLLQVSYASLAYRLLNLGIIDKGVCDRLVVKPGLRLASPEPKRFSKSFLTLVHDGIDAGYVSARKASKALGVSLPQLIILFNEHELEAPFSL